MVNGRPLPDKKEILQKISQHSWYRQACNSKLSYLFSPTLGAFDYLQSDLCFVTVRDALHFEGMYMEEEFEQKAKDLLSEQKENPLLTQEILSKVQEKMDAIEAFHKRLSTVKLAKQSKKEALALLKELDTLAQNFWSEAFSCDVFDPQGEELLQSEITKAGITFEAHELATLLRPALLHYAQKERLNLLSLAKSIKEGKSFENLADDLRAHATEYHYVDNSWESTRVLGTEDFKKKIKQLMEEGDIDEQLEDLTKDWAAEHKRIAAKHQLNPDILSVLEFFRGLFFLRDERKKGTLLCNHWYDQIYLRLSEIYEIPVQQLNLTITSDFTDDFNKEKNDLLMKQREGLVMYMTLKGKHFFASEEDNFLFYDAIHKQFDTAQQSVEGMTACGGNVKGIARIVMGETHFGKFNAGEILIAPMTRPEYLPLMKKAAAIVTDEGGITCHAAIVSRELNVPCVIGTKVCTKVFRDGDIVEVDAENGIVRKRDE